MTTFVPELRSSDRKFCAHELCPKGTVCHRTEELSTILPLASLQEAILLNSDQGQTLPQRTEDRRGGGSNVASLPETRAEVLPLR